MLSRLVHFLWGHWWEDTRFNDIGIPVEQHCIWCCGYRYAKSFLVTSEHHLELDWQDGQHPKRNDGLFGNRDWMESYKWKQ